MNDDQPQAVSEDVYRLEAGLYAQDVAARQQAVAQRAGHTNAQRRRRAKAERKASRPISRRWLGDSPPPVNRAQRRAAGIR